MPVIHAPRRPPLDLRMTIIPLIILACLLAALVRLWYIQAALAPKLEDKAQSFGQTHTPILAPRGLILDRNLKLIAGIQSESVATAQPVIVLKKPWVLDKLAAILRAAGAEADARRLLRKTQDGANKPYVPAPIFTGVPVEAAAKILEAPGDLPGISLIDRPARFYPDSRSFSQILGYVWTPSPEDVKRAEQDGRAPGQYVGKGGLEWVYEKDLVGVDGFDAMYVDKKQRPIRFAARQPPVPGSQVVLGIDALAQQAAIQALGKHRGAAVAVDPSTGEVICMASTPTYDLSLFRNGISRADFEALNDSPDHPFINRAIQAAFSPGSTFKIVTTVASMRAGVFDPNRTVFCAGGYRLGRQFFGCLGHHGAIAFEQAFEKSCNTYFSDLAMRAGKDPLRQAALDMGFFCKTGVDLPAERSGLIPTDAWLKRVHRDWVPGYTVLTGIGQGDVLTTPLQMADLAAMVANSGVVYRPHLVRAFRRGQDQELETVKPEILRQVDLPAVDWATIQDAMVGVVRHGTAAGVQIPGLDWAGKTGSAEVRGQNKTNSWFIGYAPAENPKIAICVMVEDAGHGAEVAAPIARKVVESYLLPPKRTAG